MKKILILFILLLPISVYALEDEVLEEKSSDIYLENIEIEGYSFTPNFEKYSNLYTLILEDNNVEELKIIATPEDKDTEIEIIGNKDLAKLENEIEIIVSNQDLNKENIYKIIVTKVDDSLTTALIDDIEIEPNSQEISVREMGYVAGSCLILIYFCFRIIFKKRKIKSI